VAKALLDTNVLIHLRQGRPEVHAAFRARQIEDFVVSVVTVGELSFGVERSAHPRRTRERLDALLAVLSVEPLPIESAVHYGSIRAALSAQGRIIGANDLWIAAHAKARGYVLVTANDAEFRRIDGLTVENWARL